MPPPETSLRRRRGYDALASTDDDSDGIAYVAQEDSRESDALRSFEPVPTEVTAVEEREGWSALSWSFAASGVMTVRLHYVHIKLWNSSSTRAQLLAYFFPVVFSIPLFGTYLASQWMWTFTPSLSYIGQGIIMGFPTTLSMNLVSRYDCHPL